MFKKIVLGLMILTLSLGLFPISPASAAKKPVDPAVTTCETLSINLEDYAATIPANPGQPYIATTYKQVLVFPAVAEVSHQEYLYTHTKTNGNHAVQESGWVLSKPAEVNNYTPWVLKDQKKVIDVAASEAIYATVIDNPGQSYIAPTPEKTNSVVVTIDGSTVANTTFSTSYSNTFTYSDKYVAHVYSLAVTAWDGNGSMNIQGASVPCDNLDHKIDICHANNGIKDYVKQNVDFDSIIKNNGHSEHQNGRDIIPPFDYVKNGMPGHFNGLNWGPEGQATYGANCVVTPDKPADIVEVTVKESAVNCDTQQVTITTTTTTTGTELVGNKWVATQPDVEIVVTYRAATTEELTSCIGEQPKDIVEVTTKETVNCDTKLVTIVTTTTTTSTELVGIEWVPTAPTTEEETTYRDATTEELATCPVVETPETPTDDEGDVLGDTTKIEVLPNTSANNSLSIVGLASMIILLGAIISAALRTVIVRR